MLLQGIFWWHEKTIQTPSSCVVGAKQPSRSPINLLPAKKSSDCFIEILLVRSCQGHRAYHPRQSHCSPTIARASRVEGCQSTCWYDHAISPLVLSAARSSHKDQTWSNPFPPIINTPDPRTINMAPICRLSYMWGICYCLRLDGPVETHFWKMAPRLCLYFRRSCKPRAAKTLTYLVPTNPYTLSIDKSC